MEDPGTKRREYVQKKAKLIAAAIIAGLLGLLSVGFVLRLAFLATKMSDTQFAAFLLWLVPILACTVIVIGCRKEARSIPYVPPVCEQLTDLPADEVLLRCSEQPAAGPRDLLRAAHEGQETVPAEVLLRATATEALDRNEGP